MNMIDYATLHLGINESKRTVLFYISQSQKGLEQ